MGPVTSAGRPGGGGGQQPEALGERQETVLRALVGAYVAGAGPVGSATLSHTLPVSLSSASIRNTLAELTELGLVEKPHRSAGRIPTDAGLRLFVDRLMDPRSPVDWELRRIRRELDAAAVDLSLQVASELLSRQTHQLGFAMLPRLDQVVLRHASLIRVAHERVLVVLVSESGVTYQRFVEDSGSGDQPELERLEAELNARLAGRTLRELRARLEQEREQLRSRGRLALRALLETLDALEAEAAASADLLLAGQTQVLEQPEFHDPERVREWVAALETREQLAAFLDRVLDGSGVAVTFGAEAEVPFLRGCAAVAAPCSAGIHTLGSVGVLGPTRMDYARIVPLVELLSRLVAEKLSS